MAAANDLRKGMAIKYNGNTAIVLEVHHRTPGKFARLRPGDHPLHQYRQKRGRALRFDRQSGTGRYRPDDARV